MIRCLVHEQEVVKLSWYGDVRFIEFLMAEKKILLPSYHTAQILLPQVSLSLEPSKMLTPGKGWRVMKK